MLPGAGFNSGFRDDVRGFRKKNRPGRLFQQYAPVLVVLQLLVLVVTVLVLRSSRQHVVGQLSKLRGDYGRIQQDNKNLLTSIQQERQSRTTTESHLRDSNNKLTTVERELGDLKTSGIQREHHCQGLQDSFDRTRRQLEGERDAANRELDIANQRINRLQDTVSQRERELGDTRIRHETEHSMKDSAHATKEAEWDLMREKLLSQIRASGGWIPQSPTPGAAGGHHTDYAARSGQGIYHASHDGHTERFIDSAEELERDGIVDPEGRAHLAQLLGHLYDLKVAEHIALEQAHPSGQPLQKPPIGHWMALSLESMGITCPYGTVHMAYVLDRHFSLDDATISKMKGQLPNQSTPGGQASNAHGQQQQQKAATGHNIDGAASHEQHAAAGLNVKIADGPPNTPGVVDPALHDADRQRAGGWRSRNQRNRVDSAGFV